MMAAEKSVHTIQTNQMQTNFLIIKSNISGKMLMALLTHFIFIVDVRVLHLFSQTVIHTKNAIAVFMWRHFETERNLNVCKTTKNEETDFFPDEVETICAIE